MRGPTRLLLCSQTWLCSARLRWRNTLAINRLFIATLSVVPRAASVPSCTFLICAPLTSRPTVRSAPRRAASSVLSSALLCRAVPLLCPYRTCKSNTLGTVPRCARARILLHALFVQSKFRISITTGHYDALMRPLWRRVSQLYCTILYH